MNQKHLLRFIKRKMKYNAEDFVTNHEGREITLREVLFHSLLIKTSLLLLCTLLVQADTSFEWTSAGVLQYSICWITIIKGFAVQSLRRACCENIFSVIIIIIIISWLQYRRQNLPLAHPCARFPIC